MATWASEAADEAADGKSGPQIPWGGRAVGRRIAARHFFVNPPRSAGPIPNAIGAAILVREDAIREAGPMDERIFLYGEDLDWCYRMWQHGWEVHVVPDAVMEHA